MADVIYKKGQSANLNETNVPIVNGQILVTEDKAEMFIDMSDGTRKKISDTDKVSKNELKTINGQELIGEGDITVSGVGQTTEGSGEIFNDYENNKALGRYSKASGYNTLAGIRGYYYSSINFEGEQPVITLTKEQGSEPTEEFDVAYGIGDVISLNNSSNYLNCATITNINKNKISVDSLPFTEMKSISNLKPWHYSFYVLSKPTVGECLFGYAATTEGELTKAVGEHSHAEGYKTIAMSKMSHAENEETIATGGNAHAEGWASTASGSISHAEGSGTTASGDVSHAEGEVSEAIGKVSHAEGHNTKASGHYSHTENWETQALGKYSHAEGDCTVAEGEASHTEGINSKVLVVEGDSHSGHASHAEGYNTVASGSYGAHAEGYQTQALGESSHASGKNTIAEGNYQTAIGKFNTPKDSNTLFIVGNGGSDHNRSNAFEVLVNGSATLKTMGTTDNSVATKKYVDDKVGNGSGAEISVDQTYNAESENAQSGKAVAQAIQANTTSFYNPTAGDMDSLKAVNSWAVKNAIEANIEQNFGGSLSIKAQSGSAVVEAIYENASRTYSPTDGFPQSGIAVAQAIEQAIGNVEAVLDNIITMQESLIGGATE